MLRKGDWQVIQALSKRGVYQKDIAEEIGVHRKTVSRALERGGPPKGRPGPRPSKLDPYKPRVDELVGEGVWNAMVILREIQEAGYAGGISILRDYIRPRRQERRKRSTVRFETAPGKQLQHDWAELWTQVGGERTKVYFQVNTLGFSRRFHFWCAPSLDAEHTYEGLIRALEHFGGVPAEVLVDNQKTAVAEHGTESGPRFAARFVDLAGHYGFEPKACKPRRPQTKGKDERMVGYVKGNFFQRYRSFESLTHMNQLAERWLAEEADQRRHGTVKEIVAARFEKERAALQPLPLARFDTSYHESRQVSWDCYVEVRGNRYSVPSELAGRRVTTRIGLDDSLRIFAEDRLVAAHRIQDAASGWVTMPEHHAQLWKDTLGVEQRSLEVYEEAGQWN